MNNKGQQGRIWTSARNVVFHGLVRPNVEIASREPADYAGLDAPVSIAKFHVPTVKPPKPVFYDAPLQWWRNFPEIDFDADVSVLGWARRSAIPSPKVRISGLRTRSAGHGWLSF